MIIYAIQDNYEVWGPTFTGFGGDKYVLNFTKTDSQDYVVDTIYQTYWDNPGQIECLSICAHGNSGQVYIGGGFGTRFAYKFSKLRGAFTVNSAGIEIHGCAVASATPIELNNLPRWAGIGDTGLGARRTGNGYEFLRLLASSTGVRATGCIQMTSGLLNAISYYGDETLTVNPDGTSYFTQH